MRANSLLESSDSKRVTTLSRIAANRIVNASVHTLALDELFFTKLVSSDQDTDFELARHTFYAYPGFVGMGDDGKAILFDAYVRRRSAMKILSGLQLLNHTPLILDNSYEVDTCKTVENWIDGRLSGEATIRLNNDVLLTIACHSRQWSYLVRMYAILDGSVEIPVACMSMLLGESRLDQFKYLFDHSSLQNRRITLERLSQQYLLSYPLTRTQISFIWQLHAETDHDDSVKSRFLASAFMNGAAHHDLEVCQYAFSKLEENEYWRIIEKINMSTIQELVAHNDMDIYNWYVSILTDGQRQHVESNVSSRVMLFNVAYARDQLEACLHSWALAESLERYRIYHSVIATDESKSRPIFYQFIRAIFTDIPKSCQYNVVNNTSLFILAAKANDLGMCQQMAGMMDEWLVSTIITHSTLHAATSSGYTDTCEWMCNQFKLNQMLSEMSPARFVSSIEVLQWYLHRTQKSFTNNKETLCELFTAAFNSNSKNSYAVCRYIAEVLNVNHLNIATTDCYFVSALDLGKYDLCYLFWQQATPETQFQIVKCFADMQEHKIKERTRAWFVREASGDAKSIVMTQYQSDLFKHAFLNYDLKRCDELWNEYPVMRDTYVQVAVRHFSAALAAAKYVLCQWVWDRASDAAKLKIVDLITMQHLRSALQLGSSSQMLEWILKVQCEIYGKDKKAYPVVFWQDRTVTPSDSQCQFQGQNP